MQKFACPKGCTVVTAEKPTATIKKGWGGPGLLAQVAVSKYGDHLPLLRRADIFRRQEVEISRQAMCDWMRACAEVASPLYELMKQRALGSKAVQTDDTPVPVLDPALPRTRTGRIRRTSGMTTIPSPCMTTPQPQSRRSGRMTGVGTTVGGPLIGHPRHFFSLPTCPIREIHFGTNCWKSAGSGGRFFRPLRF